MATKAKRPTVAAMRKLQNEVRAAWQSNESLTNLNSQFEEQLAEEKKSYRAAKAQADELRSEAAKMTALAATRKERIAKMTNEISDANVKIAALERGVKFAEEDAKTKQFLLEENHSMTVENESLKSDLNNNEAAALQLHDIVRDLRRKTDFRPGAGVITAGDSQCIRLYTEDEEEWTLLKHIGRFQTEGFCVTRSELHSLFNLLRG